MSRLKRLYYHGIRYKGEIIYSSVISLVLILIYSLMYPGEETIIRMMTVLSEVGLDGLFGGLDVNSPGWVFWLSLQLSMMVYFVITITAILIGSRLVPTTVEEANEVITSVNPRTTRSYFLENALTSVGVLVLISLPSYVVLLVVTLFQGAGQVIGRMTISYLLLILVSLFMVMLSASVTNITYSRKYGRAVGFGYLIYAYILGVIAESGPEYSDYANFSLNKYVGITEVIYSGEVEWQPIIVTISMIVVLLALGIWRIHYPDYIQDATSGTISLPFSLGPQARMFAPDTKIGEKYPILTEQLRKDSKPVMVVLILISSFLYSIFGFLPQGDQLGQVIASFDSPMVSAMMQNHPINPDFKGFLAGKLYSGMWIYFAIYLSLVASSLATRDVRTKTQDIILVTNVSQPRVIKERVIAMILEFTVIVWVSYAVMYLLETGSTIDFDHLAEFQIYFVMWINYLALALFLVGFSIIPKLSKGRNFALLFFIGQIVLSILAFVNESVQFLKYFTFLGYFDPIGLLYERTEFIPHLLVNILLLVVSSSFLYIMTTKHLVKKDML